VESCSASYGSIPPLPSTLAEAVAIAPATAQAESTEPTGSDMDENEDRAQDVPVLDNFAGIASADIPITIDGGRNSESTGLGEG